MKLCKREIKAKTESNFKDKVFFWKGIPVCMTRQLAEFYECSEGNISRNFNNNKEKFTVRKHFFRLTGNQVVEFARLSKIGISENTTVLYLWTRQGAARHAKMLTTDRAWDVWEELETSYFEKNTKSAWERIDDIVTPELVFQQRSIAHQKSNSNKINAENAYSDDNHWVGRSAAIAYNQRNCIAITERTPASWRQEGRTLGLPRMVTRSAKAVARVVQPELACARSMADRLVLDGIDEPVAFEVATSCIHTFRLIRESGWRPKEFQN